MKQLIACLLLATAIGGLTSCKDQKGTTMNEEKAKAGITSKDWGEADGKKVMLYTLTNNSGMEVKITNYGGIVTSWMAPGKDGSNANIVLGFDDLQGYMAPPPYFGAIIGRYGNRISKGKFSIDGQEYTLATNNGQNHLHGGDKGFDKVVWDAAPVNENEPALTLTYLSKDGEEGYPGNLKVTVKYTLTDANELLIEYDAETDKATPVNLTNHSYFNLSGDHTTGILNHSLMIDADKYTPVDTTLIPTGELKDVTGTPFDFRQFKQIGADIAKVEGGYDHNWVLNRKGSDLQRVAVLSDAASGRQLEVHTTEPGIQFYSGNFLDGTLSTSNGKAINKHAALCLETQHFPDSPNQPSFPTTILKPGEKYHTVTKYVVTVAK
ncbi:aldose epimerase family protein [Aridibaculum aurantiacum]|uniref:aldose epimerase family protein n=1 Tax=Aridibaculum aurantiacum TaxID=2810307 RepID=UPI001A96F787|nr:aldose epimerase family protein [Aridibaculum aurantiacum]